jgi:hypothetical protein
VSDIPLQTKITSPLRLSGVTLTPVANLAVRVLNRPDDTDADRVFDDSPKAHIPYASGSAWVKYAMSAKADGKLGFAEVDAKASTDVALSDYRIHAATDSAWSALSADLTSPRTLLDVADVQKLQTGEALTMEIGGALTASISFSWSDLLSAKLADVLHELPLHAPVAVKLKNGLEAAIGVKLTDQFSVVISRTTGGHFRFAIKKARSRNHTYSVEAALSAELSGMPSVDQVLDRIFDAVKERIDDSAVDDARAKIRAKLAELLRWKAAIGFAYEYARIDENDSVADFILLDETRLPADHALVLSGDFARVAETLRTDTTAHSIIRYLNEDTVTRRATYGFSLGLGKWLDVKAQDSSVFRQTTRTSLDGFRLIISRGTRKYDEKNIPQNDFEWVIDLKAQMTEFLETPTSRDFDYGLHFLVTLDRGALAEGDLERMLDFAAMWDVQVPAASDFVEVIGKKGTIRVQLLFERDALASALARPADIDSWAAPLAMAMPYMSSFPERRSFAARRDVYTNAWRAWLHDQPYAIQVKSGLTIFERQNRPGSFAWTAGEGHPQLRLRLEAFMRGAELLRDAMQTARKPEVIGDAYAALEQFWSQRLYVAAAGRWLLDRADAHRTMQIEYGEETITV